MFQHWRELTIQRQQVIVYRAALPQRFLARSTVNVAVDIVGDAG